MDGMARPRDYRKMYEGLVAGDPQAEDAPSHLSGYLLCLRSLHQELP